VFECSYYIWLGLLPFSNFGVICIICFHLLFIPTSCISARSRSCPVSKHCMFIGSLELRNYTVSIALHFTHGLAPQLEYAINRFKFRAPRKSQPGSPGRYSIPSFNQKCTRRAKVNATPISRPDHETVAQPTLQ